MSPDPTADCARLRAVALALPEAAEKLSHGMPMFHIPKAKSFAWFTHDHHGCGITAVIVRVTGIEEHELLVEADPALYYRPAYFVAKDWIGIRTDAPGTDWDHIADRVAQSWEIAAPRRLLEMGGR